jgi:hypothetical protein
MTTHALTRTTGPRRRPGPARGRTAAARATPVRNVVRYLLLDRATYFVLPWAWSAVTFALDAGILSVVPAGGDGRRWVGGLAAVFVVVFVVGVQCVARALPFGLALGVSRGTYFRGASLLAVLLAVCFGTAVVAGQAAERATDGWGLRMAYFRVPGVLDGPWWQVWLTAVAAFVTLFAYGMWHGLANRSAGLAGTLVFSATQGVVLLAATAAVAWTDSWDRVGSFLTATGAVPALLAGIAALLLTGGYVTVRRLTF